MKIAGRKNDGAWYRTNLLLRSLNADEKALLSVDASLVSAYTALYDILTDIATHSGADPSAGPAGITSSMSLLSQHMATGIPRAVYQGKLAWDVYDTVASGQVISAGWHVLKDSAVGQWTVERNMDNSTNSTGHNIVHPRNQSRMAAVGAIIRWRMNRLRLFFRTLKDIGNSRTLAEGNPGGIADAHKDA